MYIAPEQAQTAPRGHSFYVNRKALSFYPFVASYEEISLKSDFIQFFHDLIHVYSPGTGEHTAPRGLSFDVNRNVLSLRSSIASFKLQTTIVSEKSIVLPFSHTKASGIKFDLAVK